MIMKKILTLLLLAMLAFTACDGDSDSGGGSDGANDEERQLAEAYANSMGTMMASSTSGLVPAEGVEPGFEQGIPRTAMPAYTFDVEIDIPDKTMSGTITMTYDNVADGDGSVDGEIVYTMEAEWDDSYEITTASGTMAGTVTITSGSSVYVLVFALIMEQTGSTATVTGYITVNDARVDINESISI